MQTFVSIFQASLNSRTFTMRKRMPSVGKNRESPLVVLEGHMRLTAMLLASECLPAELEVLVGFSEQIEHRGVTETSLVA